MEKSVKIAIADDEPEVREYFALVIQRMGHEVVVAAEDGQQLVDACRIRRPDLLITDIYMEGLSGIEALQQLSQGGPMPTILVSAHARPDALLAECNGQVLAFLTKPIKFAELQAAIIEAISRLS